MPIKKQNPGLAYSTTKAFFKSNLIGNLTNSYKLNRYSQNHTTNSKSRTALTLNLSMRIWLSRSEWGRDALPCGGLRRTAGGLSISSPGGSVSCDSELSPPAPLQPGAIWKTTSTWGSCRCDDGRMVVLFAKMHCCSLICWTDMWPRAEWALDQWNNGHCLI